YVSSISGFKETDIACLRVEVALFLACQFFSVSFGGCNHDKMERGGPCPGTGGAIAGDLQSLALRDDLSGMQLSGNKVRKLEFLLADAVAQGADCIVTIGGIQSNHCRATAVAAKYLNLDCYLILRTSKNLVEKDPGLTGNLLVERLIGAHIDLVSKEEYAKVGSVALTSLLKERLLKEGRRPYVIPVGGSNSLGTWGYIEAIREIEQQLQKGTTEVGFDDIVVACGSGGTIAGLSIGSWLSELKAKVHAFCVCDDPDYFYDYAQGLLDGLQAGVKSRDIVNIENAKGLGYAMNTTEELKFVKEVAQATGVILDPVYRFELSYFAVISFCSMTLVITRTLDLGLSIGKCKLYKGWGFGY
ncbi:hypothetical protein RJ639_002165, partial [Escallonia herrerae]